MFFYNLSIQFYKLGIMLVSPFHKKAKNWLSGRKKQWNNLEQAISKIEKPLAWFHCSSLGEFEQARPIIESFDSQYAILITFFSPSGYLVRKSYAGADHICYLPLDTAGNAKKFIDFVNPKIAYFIKYEFWYHFAHECKKRQIPILSASAIFRSNQYFFKKSNKIGKKTLSCFNHFYVQNEESKELLGSIGINNSTVSGDTRFDRVKQLTENKKSIKEIENFKGDNQLLVVGSSWPQDLKVIMPIINQLRLKVKVIIASHEIDEKHLSEIESTTELRTIRFSNFSDYNNQQLLVIDNIGMLSGIYSYADIVYVGGAFASGLHNILEAATYGKPVIFGPKYDKFQEAKDLVKLKGAFTISSTEEFGNVLQELITSEAKLEEIRNITTTYIEENIGATNTILNHSKQFLNP